MKEIRIKEEIQRMIHKTSIKTHPKILNACYYSLKLHMLLEQLFFQNVYYGDPYRGFGTIQFYLMRVEKLSEKNIALRIIEREFKSFSYNSDLSKVEARNKIQEVMKHLREALKN